MPGIRLDSHFISCNKQTNNLWATKLAQIGQLSNLTLKIKSGKGLGPPKKISVLTRNWIVSHKFLHFRVLLAHAVTYIAICRSLLWNNYVYWCDEFCMCVKSITSVLTPSQRICKWRIYRSARGIYTISLPCGSARPVFGQRTDIQCFVAQFCENTLRSLSTEIPRTNRVTEFYSVRPNSGQKTAPSSFWNILLIIILFFK